MTYYRAYRPLRFSDLKGQDAVGLTMQQALLQDRLSHAYLFSGPRGTGKTSTARILARAATCSKPKVSADKGSYEPCNSCEVCQSILANRAPDCIEIDAASNRGIDDIRTLREEALYPPIQAPRKIYIIDEVHMLTPEAFNALLKTLEEPPEHCIFILATTEMHKVPVTIRSRCQIIRFHSGSVETIKQKLDSIVKSEDINVETGVTSLIATHATGGFRDAETMLEHLATQHNPLTLASAREHLGILEEEKVASLLENTLDGNSDQVAALIKEHFASSAASLEGVISQLIELTRHHIYSPSKKRYPADLLAYALEQFLHAHIYQRSTPIPSVPLEIACLNIAARTASPVTAASVPRTPSKPSEGAPPSSAPRSQPPDKPAAQAAKADLPVQPTVLTPTPQPTVPVVELPAEAIADIRKAWKRMIELISKENIVLGQSLKDTVLHTAKEGIITIHVRFRFHADIMNERKARARIQELLAQLTGSSWNVQFEVHTATPPRRPRRAISDSQASQAIQNDAVAVFQVQT